MALYLKKSFGPQQMRKGLTVLVQTPEGYDYGSVLAWGEKGCTVELVEKGMRGGVFYENIVKAIPANAPPEEIATDLSGKLSQMEPADEQLTPNDIHLLCEQHGIAWNDDPDFMRWCFELTHERRLDEMPPEKLAVVAEAIERGERPASIHRWAEAVERPAKKSWWRRLLRRA